MPPCHIFLAIFVLIFTLLLYAACAKKATHLIILFWFLNWSCILVLISIGGFENGKISARNKCPIYCYLKKDGVLGRRPDESNFLGTQRVCSLRWRRVKNWIANVRGAAFGVIRWLRQSHKQPKSRQSVFVVWQQYREYSCQPTIHGAVPWTLWQLPSAIRYIRPFIIP